MNFQKLVFKFIIVLTYLLRVALLVLPIALVVVITKEGGWKYGFTFIQNSLNVAFFVSFAIGFLVSMYHAVSFDEVEGAPDQNYMKSHQVVYVSSDKEIQEVLDWMVSNEKYKGRCINIEVPVINRVITGVNGNNSSQETPTGTKYVKFGLGSILGDGEYNNKKDNITNKDSAKYFIVFILKIRNYFPL